MYREIQDFFKPFISLLVLLCCWTTLTIASPESWTHFATSPLYFNSRILDPGINFLSTYYFDSANSLLWVRITCGQLCGRNSQCHAFNLYQKGSVHVCEFLADNLCQQSTTQVLVDWPGSLVWDKLSTGMSRTCLEAKSLAGAIIACESLRPGCLGTWPNCYDCIKTCSQCQLRYASTGLRNCTFWPEGLGPYATPLQGLCNGDFLYLIRRRVNQSSGVLTSNYFMEPEDMHRIFRMKSYSQLQFCFLSSTDSRCTLYSNAFVDEQGKLMNLTYNSLSANADILNLKGGMLNPAPFVTVTDDRYGCGSFWLLDPNNATYCPGGNISMLGTPKVVGSQVVQTGMRIGQTWFDYVSILLFP